MPRRHMIVCALFGGWERFSGDARDWLWVRIGTHPPRLARIGESAVFPLPIPDEPSASGLRRYLLNYDLQEVGVIGVINVQCSLDSFL